MGYYITSKLRAYGPARRSKASKNMSVGILNEDYRWAFIDDIAHETEMLKISQISIRNKSEACYLEKLSPCMRLENKKRHSDRSSTGRATLMKRMSASVSH